MAVLHKIEKMRAAIRSNKLLDEGAKREENQYGGNFINVCARTKEN